MSVHLSPLHLFVSPDAEIKATVSAMGTPLLSFGGIVEPVTLTLFLGYDSFDRPGSKAKALAILARMVAAVEALPDDVHPDQGTLDGEAA